MKKTRRKPTTLTELVPWYDMGYFMANVSPDDSGTGYRLSFSRREIAGKPLPCDPQFLIVVGKGDVQAVMLNDPRCPKGLPAASFRRIMRFVELNRRTIMDFWNERLSDPELFARLLKLED